MFLSLSICAQGERQDGCDHPAMLPQPHTCATHMVPPINTPVNSSLCTFSLPSATELVFRKIAATRRPTNVAHAAKDENRRLGPGRGPSRVQGRTRGATGSMAAPSRRTCPDRRWAALEPLLTGLKL